MHKDQSKNISLTVNDINGLVEMHKDFETKQGVRVITHESEVVTRGSSFARKNASYDLLNICIIVHIFKHPTKIFIYQCLNTDE